MTATPETTVRRYVRTTDARRLDAIGVASPPRPVRARPGGRRTLPALGAALAMLVAATGCKTSPRADGRVGADAAKAGSSGDTGADGTDGAAPGAGAAASERDQRVFRLDALVRQWDAAQSDGREDVAKTLAEKIAADVDGDYAFFESASRGQQGLRTQNLSVQVLAFSRNPGATALLSDRLNDLDGSVVGNALIGLKIRSDPSTPVPPLVTLLRANFPEARRYAPLALANVVRAREAAGRPIEARLSDEAMSGLVGLVQDTDPYVRLHAAKAMGALRRSDATDFLVLLLKDTHGTIRLAAAAALERIGDPRAFPPVIALLDRTADDQKSLVRDVLVSYAERIQGHPMTDAERKALDVSPRAWDRWFAARDTSAPPSSRVEVSPGRREPLGPDRRKVAPTEPPPPVAR